MKLSIVSPEEHGDACKGEVPEIPEDLIERIIVSGMAFPPIFKAAWLSKSWNLKFDTSTPSKSFQKQTAAESSKCSTYCPMYVSKGKIFSFDKGSQRWRNIVTLSYLPATVISTAQDRITVTCYGSLLCVTSSSSDPHGNPYESSFFVTNLVTRCWKELPCCPGSKIGNGRMKYRTNSNLEFVRIIPAGIDGYKVLSVYIDAWASSSFNMYYRYIYDSKLNTWATMERRQVKKGQCLYRSSAYVDGKVYCFGFDFKDQSHLWVHVFDENSWISAPTDMRQIGIDFINYGVMLLCGDKVVVVTRVQLIRGAGRGARGEIKFQSTIKIFEVIRDSLQLKQMGTTPPPNTWENKGHHNRLSKINYAGDANFVYLGWCERQDSVLRFNVHSHEWDELPSSGYCDLSLKERVWGNEAF